METTVSEEYPATFKTPRDFQTKAIREIRRGFKEHRVQMLMAPTGAGKTVLAMMMIWLALQRFRVVWFICDRINLVNQTSMTADQLGMTEHGIMMAQHWRFNANYKFQICSAQTLIKRGIPDEVDLIFVDEAHTTYASVMEHIQGCKAHVIGLSATPFTKGLGKTYTRLINATTMKELTDAGILVPLRVFSCTPIDMKGAKTSNGEWSDNAVAERGSKIVGDVVTEWVNSPEARVRKTIGFCANVAHCEELCKQFNEVGVSAAAFTYQTSDGERDALLAEYRKPDSSLRVLVSVEALAKGFDVPDVGCILDCRPIKKSLSTVMQMIGRGLRSYPGKADCIDRNTLVLTDHGEVEICRITHEHKVWDGINFVAHGGAICRGEKFVMEYDGLIATPDHKVMTKYGWLSFEEAHRRRERITRSGIGREGIRVAKDREQSNRWEIFWFDCRSSVRSVLWNLKGSIPQHSEASKKWALLRMSYLQWSGKGSCAEMALPPLPAAIAALHEFSASCLARLRWAWNRVSFFVRKCRFEMDRQRSWNQGHVDANRSHRQQRTLRTRQSSLGEPRREYGKHQGFEWLFTRLVHSDEKELSGSPVRRFDDGPLRDNGNDRGTDRRSMAQPPLMQAKREVWDILNAGPLQRFTANGRLVHNCILHDHSGNILRFWNDFEQVYNHGLDSMDDGEKLDSESRAEPEESEKKGCPSCGHKPFSKLCVSCGFEVLKPALIEVVPGEMREITLNGKKMADDNHHLWQQCCAYARAGKKPETANGRAWHLYKDITGQSPPKGWHIDRTDDVPVTANVFAQIKRKQIAWSKSKNKRIGHE